MYHLLTRSDKRAAKKEYRMRLLTVGLFLFLASVAIALTSLLPSLFLTRAKKAALDAEESRIAAQNGATEENALTDETEAAKLKLSLLKPEPSKKTVFEALHGVFKAMPLGVVLNGFFFSQSDSSHISLTGTARRRENLVSYQKQLVASGFFTKVEVPLSDFAGSSNLDFTISLSGDF